MRLFTFFLLLIVNTAAIGQSKHALLVCVSNYAPSSNWNTLSSNRDAEMIEVSLRLKGFRSSEIALLKDSEATKKGILNALQSLLTESRPGDFIYFHFSGHGQQVYDESGDEADGYDEALVPYDASKDFQPGENNHLIDDELKVIFDNIRDKIGPAGNVLVTIDACHSASATRNVAHARGTYIPYQPKNYRPQRTAKTDEQTFGMTSGNNSRAPMVSFFATAANELNFEATDETKEPCGSLSLAFCRSLGSITAQSSYRTLFESILFQMSNIAPYQSPQSEGNLDAEVFTANKLVTLNSFRIKTVIDDSTVIINGGRLAGLENGTSVNFYPPDVRDTTGVNPLMRGVITKADQLYSEIRIPYAVGKEKILSLWLIPQTVSFGDAALSIKFENHCGKCIDSVYKWTSVVKGISLNESTPDLTISVFANRILAKDATGAETGLENMQTLKQDLIRFLTRRAKTSFLKSLQVSNNNLSAKMEIMRSPGVGSKNSTGIAEYKIGEEVSLKLTNMTDKVIYYNIIDIQPDNQINLLYPSPDQAPRDCLLEPNSVKEDSRTFVIGRPTGIETLKMILTDKPLDLKYLFMDQDKSVNSGNSESLDVFFEDFFNGGTKTKGGRIKWSGSNVNIDSFVYKIVT